MTEETLAAEAPAKVNLGLRVRSPDHTGLHPVVSLVQTIDRRDTLSCEETDSDRLEAGDADVPEGRDNLVWRAAEAVRARTHDRRPLAFRLTKRIPVAAGLAGGSADAAAALVLLGSMFRLDREVLRQLAAGLGADVPFSLEGGFSWMEGHGERLTPLSPVPGDYALAVVVPPFRMSTRAVYTGWDRLGGPEGEGVTGRVLPPSLRAFAPLANDLYPAAVHLQPELADWNDDLQRAWGRPVLLSGSGPSLFAFFRDAGEATDAIESAPSGARARFAARPTGYGARPAPR